ncbi:MAG: bifunctional folylpolyglutamate synthase/dihydrofolate synthase [Bacteroidales bacterium]|nr:bifunctional folylpolyglutamate synthase/dihydrofolate synthase [Bacteroidales bacterium]MBR1782528.1 bifunctional folylpolyglutamate synthase/dihydrofolate synthase [Bacteroidales bacterium]
MDGPFNVTGYEALLKDIFKRFPSVQGSGFTPGSYKPGLEHMRAFDEALGFPSRELRTIHIAGTNGKGSVASMLASAFGACGYKAGLFTSPHLTDFRERIKIGGEMIPKDYVQAFLTAWLPWIQEHDLSFFEITTGLAFKWFREQKVDVAVIETGLGGRLDSTNILRRPELCVVTSIGLDHMALLGDTRARIAAEKAGIFKADVPALVGEKDAETAPVFEEKAQGLCPLHYASESFPSLWGRHKAILEEMDLPADVQKKNLRTVLVAIDLLKDRFQGLQNADAVIEGITHAARRTAFRGRWERLSEQPYVVADIGHNAQALEYNFARLKKDVESGQFSSLIIVYGIMADKDLDAILPLMPVDATYIFAAPGTPRALPAAELLQRFNQYRQVHGLPARAFLSGSVREAVLMATQLAQGLSTQLSRSASAPPEVPPLIYIGGSAFVVAEALPLFKA